MKQLSFKEYNKMEQLILLLLCLKLIQTYKIRCPGRGQWIFRSSEFCQRQESYVCLYNVINNEYSELCNGPRKETGGDKTVINIKGKLTNIHCSDSRYQPEIFRTTEGSDCVYQKSSCSEEGQKIGTNGTSVEDRICRCDYTRGYAFVSDQRDNHCFCRPADEDCSCYVKTCAKWKVLSPDYSCIVGSNLWKKFRCSRLSKNKMEKSKEVKVSRIDVYMKNKANFLVVFILIIVVLSSLLGLSVLLCGRYIDNLMDRCVFKGHGTEQHHHFSVMLVGESCNGKSLLKHGLLNEELNNIPTTDWTDFRWCKVRNSNGEWIRDYNKITRSIKNIKKFAQCEFWDFSGPKDFFYVAYQIFRRVKPICILTVDLSSLGRKGSAQELDNATRRRYTKYLEDFIEYWCGIITETEDRSKLEAISTNDITKPIIFVFTGTDGVKQQDMAKAFPEHALILFDLHGEVAVVQTQKLTPASKIKVAARLTIALGNQPLLVEVLELSDDTSVLKNTEEKWTSTHRGIAIEKEISRRQKAPSNNDGGYLDIWPENEILNHQQKKKAVTKKRTNSSKPNSNKETATKRPRIVENQPISTQSDSYIEEIGFPYDMQIQSSGNNQTSKGVQTDTVVVIGTDMEAQTLAAKNQQVTISKKEMATQTIGKKLSVHEKLDKIIRLLEEKKHPRHSVDFLTSLLQDNCVQQLDQPIITENITPENSSDLDKSQTTITNFYLPMPDSDTSTPTILSLPEIPTRASTSSSIARTFQLCAKGPIVEVSSYLDVGAHNCIGLVDDHELRVDNQKMWRTQKDSCSCSNFAWNLTKDLYTFNELRGKNYHGRKGKVTISPIRRHAIEHAVSDVYGPELLPTAVKAINTGLRNMDRYKKTNSED